MNRQQYTVHVNNPRRSATGHIEGCPNAKQWAGRIDPDSHLGPFNTRGEAETAARLTGNPFHWCGLCSRNKRD
jgi:hypothetical protein